jgi:adenosylcobinamide-GDP ribazoletransferase
LFDTRTIPGADPAPPDDPPADPRTRSAHWLAEIRIATVFLTVLPIRLRPADAGHGVSHAVRAFPIAGIPVGLAGALAYALADLAGLSATIAGLLAVGAMAAMAGGLHEDGLADAADGVFGGRTPAERLAIMRDSRLGTFGAIALFLALALRATALSYAGSAWDAGCAMTAAATASRAAIPPLMLLLPPARGDGLARDAGEPDRHRVVDSVALGLVLAALAFAPVAEPLTILAALAAGALAAAAVGGLARARLGGHTGDALGAAQQAAEIAILLAFVASP